MIPIADNNPTRIFPVLTYAIIALCVVAFVGQVLSPYGFEWSIYTYGFIPIRLFADPEMVLTDHNIAHALEELDSMPWQTLFTSMFMHGSLMHIGGNMLYLWVFGDNLENDLGRVKFAVFYLLCGLVAAFSQGLADPTSVVPMVGASGAIAGVLGGYLVLHPQQRVTVLIPNAGITQVPAVVVLGMWFVYQVVLGLANMGGEGGGVAFWAHVGGFVAGVVLVKVFQPR